MGITLASFMALGTMPCSNDMFIIMESGTLHGLHSCFKRIMLIPSSPVLFLALHAFNIVIISVGPVGVKYSDDGLGLLPR